MSAGIDTNKLWAAPIQSEEARIVTIQTQLENLRGLLSLAPDGYAESNGLRNPATHLPELLPAGDINGKIVAGYLLDYYSESPASFTWSLDGVSAEIDGSIYSQIENTGAFGPNTDWSFLYRVLYEFSLEANMDILFEYLETVDGWDYTWANSMGLTREAIKEICANVQTEIQGLTGLDNTSLIQGNIELSGADSCPDCLYLTENNYVSMTVFGTLYDGEESYWWGAVDTADSTSVSTTVAEADASAAGVYIPVGVVVCGDPVEEEPLVECPPPCVGDPMAATPNWTRLTEKEPFLNAKTCEYSIVLRTEYEATSKDNLYSDPDYLTKGVEKLLDHYGKKTDPYYAKLSDGSAGTDLIDPVSLCVNAGTIKDTVVSTRPFVKMKALVVVPYDTFVSIEDEEQPETQPDRKDQPAFVILKGSDFLLMNKQVSRAMNILAVRQAKWFWNEGGRLSEPTFNPKEEATRIRIFKKAMLELLRANDFVVRKPALFAKKWVEEIEIGFDENMGIDYVKALEKGCDKPEMMIKMIGAFKSIEPQTLPRTMYFVSQLPEMWNDFTAVEPIEFGDFLSRYVAFPPITIEADETKMTQEPIFCPDNSAAGNIDDDDTYNLGDEFSDLGKSIWDEILSYPDALADRLAEDMCLSLEGKKKNKVKLDDLKELSARAADTALREFFTGDRNLEKIPELLAEMSGDPEELWQKMLDKLGVCGLLALLEMAFSCLFAGLSAQDAMSEMIKAAFNAMDEANFEKIFIGLPPDVQAEIFGNISEELQSIPPPWDADYRSGSYSGQGTTKSVDQTQAPNWSEGEPFGVWQSQTVTTEGGVSTTVGSTTGVVINEAAIGASYGNPGSIGTAADNIMDSVVSAYKDAIINMINNNLIDLDVLMEALNSIPGAQVVARIINQMDCPPLPLFTPPIGDFFKTLDMDFCRGHFAITLPEFNFNVAFGDIFALIINVAKELIKELVVKLIILVLKKLLEIIFEALCAMLGMIGGAFADALSGGNQIKQALGDALCAEASDEDVDAAMRQMMEATGIKNCTNPSDVPTSEDAAAFTEIIAAVLTNSEVLDLLSGDASPQVTQMIADIVTDQIPGLACMQPSDIQGLFSSLGTVINPELIERAQQIESLSAPVCDSICASPAQLQRFNDVRCAIMQDKGLSAEECEEQINSLTDRAKEDLADLANILSGGPFQGFPDLVGDDPSCPDNGDPFAPGGSILPAIPKILNDVANDSAKRIFDRIAEQHIDDLIDRRGFFDMVLSDSNGAGLKQHTELVDSFMGEPLTDDIGFFQFYTDNWMDDQGGSALEGSSINTDGNRGTAGAWPFGVTNNVGTGGFPLTVASLLQYYFASYNQQPDITTLLPVDGGMASLVSSMRGENLSYDPSDLARNTVRGVKWKKEDTPESDYTKARKLQLNYSDYSEDDSDRYSMRMDIRAAIQPDTDGWDSVSRTETIIYEDLGGAGEEEVQRFMVTSPIDSDVQSLIDSLSLSSNAPLDETAFANYLASIVEGYGDYTGSSTVDMKSLLRSTIPYLQDVYMRKFALLLASNSDGKASPSPDPYQFGYTTSQQVKEVYLGGPDANLSIIKNNSEKWYNGTTGAEGRLEENQEAIFERFGGSYNNPPFYLKNPERNGWLGMMDKFVPEPDACDPVDGSEPREPICKFDDLKDLYTDLMNKYQDDPRLFTRPGASCNQPVPFNEIFTRGASAGVDSTIKAAIRIYVIEAMLRGTAIFSVYGGDCYDEILSNYIVKFIDEDIQKMGVWGLPSKKYYYLFMEQIVQMFGRQVDLGMIQPTSDEQQAMCNLNALQLTFPTINPGLFGKSVYNNERGDMIQAALDHEMDGTWATAETCGGNAGIRTLLSHFVLEEIRTMTKQFEESLYPDGMPVPNLPTLFFGSSAFVQGNDAAGTAVDVWNGLTGDDSNVYEADLVATSGGVLVEGSGPYPSLAGGFKETSNGIGNHPFRLEKYVRITEKDGAPEEVSGREERLKGVVGVDTFASWVSSMSAETQAMQVSELFENIKLGYRLVFTTSPSKVGNQDWSGEAVGTELASEIDNIVSSMSTTSLSEKTLKIPVDTSRYAISSTYVPDEETAYMYMIPIASAELSLTSGEYATGGLGGGTISDFSGDLAAAALDNRSCLVDELAQSPEYRLLFETCIPFKKMLSWLAIYTVNNFMPSVGWRQDGWVKDGGKWMGFGKGFRSWNQKSFEKSKRAVKAAFMQFYHSSDPTYEDEDEKQRKKKITKDKKPKSNKDPGWRWFIFRARIEKPTDKNEIICP
tara:strand:+ start:14225 stop:21022 length:6798 start_codon:yes stop_codon:yes gene_type:complete